VGNLTVGTGRTLTIANGKTLVVNGTLTMSGNNIDSTAGLIEIVGTITRTSGVVIGPMKKDFTGGVFPTGDAPDAPQVTTFIYPVGTASGYFPVDVTPTAGSSGSLTVQNFDGSPAGTTSATTLQRYWALSVPAGSIQADLRFHYLGSTASGTETNYNPIRVTGGVARAFLKNCPSGPCVDTTAGVKTIFMPQVAALDGSWTAGELAPTAATVAVSGRVLSADGQALRGVSVMLDDGTGHPMTALTNAFGYFHFDDVRAGSTCLLNAQARGFIFTPRVVSVTDQLTDLDLTALP
jgi:hypothetical protein